jgi:6,7-dimethyl-8-ribityllumazine synthase
MSNELPERPDPLTPPRHFAIVASRYNAEFVEGLAEAALAELSIIAPGSQIEVLRVPGSFEIPLAVKRIARTGRVNAVFAFGLLFEGETRHAELIASSVTTALLNISLEFDIPVLHEVLVVKDVDQARARCQAGSELNRGVDAARSAVRMLTMLDELAEDADLK